MSRSLTDIIASNIPEEKEMILSPWLESGTINMIYAPTGVGKTFIALLIAVTIAAGHEFLGWAAPKIRKVLYIDGEMGIELLLRRFQGILNNLEQELGHKPDVSRLKIMTKEDFDLGIMPNLSDPEENVPYLREARKSDVVIFDNLDSLSDYTDPKDNDVAEWKRIRKLAMILRAKNKCVIFIDHATKTGSQYGSSKKGNAADTVLELRPVQYRLETNAENFFEVHFKKGRSLTRTQKEPLFVEQINNDVEPEYPLLYWRYDSLRAVQKRICSRLRAKSEYPRATYKTVAHTLGVSWQEAQAIWDDCDADVLARKEKDKPSKAKSKLPQGEINLDGIDI